MEGNSDFCGSEIGLSGAMLHRRSFLEKGKVCTQHFLFLAAPTFQDTGMLRTLTAARGFCGQGRLRQKIRE